VRVQSIEYGKLGHETQAVESLRHTGFVVLRGLPLDPQILKSVYWDWSVYFVSNFKFFDRYDETTQSGYFPFKTENAKDAKAKDLKEFYHFYERFPLPVGMSQATRRLHRELVAIGQEVLGWVEANVPEDVRAKFSERLVGMTENCDQHLLRILHYPPLDGTEGPGAVRAAAHTDINLLTVLVSATQPGLQVQDREGGWHDVEADPLSVVVNAGDFLQALTGGHIKSTVHRVVNPAGDAAKRSRYSCPLFLHARPDVRLTDTLTAGQYLDQRLKEIGVRKG
jgi:isopenicillin N synthase-like dioxygenase